MNSSARPDPRGKPVSLFVTCLVDVIRPQTGIAAVRLLEHLGIPVEFRQRQTCCGQPAYNGGYRHDAALVAAQFLHTFADAEVVVVPSGSCTAMIRHEMPILFRDDPARLAQAQHLASITWEFTEFLVDGLGIVDLGLQLPQHQTFAFHDSCHGLRLLGLGQAARMLMSHVANAELIELPQHDECCGFGGLFAVKMPEVSSAMLQRKMDNIRACAADTIIAGDVSCLMHINGGLARQGSAKRVRHIAEVLADGLPER